MQVARRADEQGQRAQVRVEKARQRLDAAQRELAAAERALHAWTTGAAGERLVAEAVAELESVGWRVLHDVHWPGRQKANIDHVLVGPGGILVVDAKNWKGRVEIRGGVLRIGTWSKSDVVSAARAAARDVAAFLDARHGRLVFPVLCFVEQDLPPRLLGGDVWVVDRDRLVDWVTGLAPVLDETETHAIWGHLGRQLDGEQSPDLPRAVVPRPRQAPTRVHGRQSTRGASKAQRSRAWLGLRLAAAVAILLAYPLWAPVLQDVVADVLDASRPAATDPADPSPTVVDPLAPQTPAPVAPVP